MTEVKNKVEMREFFDMFVFRMDAGRPYRSKNYKGSLLLPKGWRGRGGLWVNYNWDGFHNCYSVFVNCNDRTPMRIDYIDRLGEVFDFMHITNNLLYVNLGRYIKTQEYMIVNDKAFGPESPITKEIFINPRNIA